MAATGATWPLKPNHHSTAPQYDSRSTPASKTATISTTLYDLTKLLQFNRRLQCGPLSVISLTLCIKNGMVAVVVTVDFFLWVFCFDCVKQIFDKIKPLIVKSPAAERMDHAMAGIKKSRVFL